MTMETRMMRQLLFVAFVIVAPLTMVLTLPVVAQDYRKGAEAYERSDYAAALQEWRPLRAS